MLEKCKISSIDTVGARVILINKDNKVTPPIAIAANIGTLEVGDMVAAIFFGSLCDGLIIAKYGG